MLITHRAPARSQQRPPIFRRPSPLLRDVDPLQSHSTEEKRGGRCRGRNVGGYTVRHESGPQHPSIFPGAPLTSPTPTLRHSHDSAEVPHHITTRGANPTAGHSTTTWEAQHRGSSHTTTTTRGEPCGRAAQHRSTQPHGDQGR